MSDDPTPTGPGSGLDRRFDDNREEGDGAVALTLLTVDGALLAAFALVFTPLYLGAVPVPLGALLSIVTLPWLVSRAGTIDTRPSMAGAPLWAWLIMLAVLSFIGPGGDALLPLDWQSAVLVVGSLGAGLWALRRVLLTEFGAGRSHG